MYLNTTRAHNMYINIIILAWGLPAELGTDCWEDQRHGFAILWPLLWNGPSCHSVCRMRSCRRMRCAQSPVLYPVLVHTPHLAKKKEERNLNWRYLINKINRNQKRVLTVVWSELYSKKHVIHELLFLKKERSSIAFKHLFRGGNIFYKI